MRPSALKLTILLFLAVNPILLSKYGPFIAGWVLIGQFIFTSGHGPEVFHDKRHANGQRRHSKHPSLGEVDHPEPDSSRCYRHGFDRNLSRRLALVRTGIFCYSCATP